VNAALLVAILANSLEEAAREIARQEGCRGMTLLSGRGIPFPEHLTFLGLSYQGVQTILAVLLDEVTACRIVERLNTELRLQEPFQGLAFCIPVEGTGGIEIAVLHQFIGQHPPVDSL
jgi:hypothetical protein